LFILLDVGVKVFFAIIGIILYLSIYGLFVSALKGSVSNWFYTRAFIFLIGGMCYSIYLLHFVLFFLLVKTVLFFNVYAHRKYWSHQLANVFN